MISTWNLFLWKRGEYKSRKQRWFQLEIFFLWKRGVYESRRERWSQRKIFPLVFFSVIPFNWIPFFPVALTFVCVAAERMLILSSGMEGRNPDCFLLCYAHWLFLFATISLDPASGSCSSFSLVGSHFLYSLLKPRFHNKHAKRQRRLCVCACVRACVCVWVRACVHA